MRLLIAVIHRCTQRRPSVKEVTVKIEEIKVRTLTWAASSITHGILQKDPSIPVRSSKKTGARSKKELREEVRQFIATPTP